MVVVRRIRGRGIRNGVVVVDGRLLFAPGGQVNVWSRRLTRAVRDGVERAAPSNKRPRWAHYGKPLKKTIVSTTRTDMARMMVKSAVGSTAHYSTFPDQGTKDFNAKILPPWKSRGYQLRERTQWIRGTKKQRGVIKVRGQEAQHYFEDGVEYGFRRMGVAPGISAEAEIKGAISEVVASLPDFLGNTPVDAAFKAQLQVWRKQRIAAFRDIRRKAGRPTQAPTQTRQKAKQARISQRKVDEVKRTMQADRAKKRRARERAEEAAKQKATRQRIAKKNLASARAQAEAFLRSKATRAKQGTKISMSRIEVNDVLVGYAVTITTKGGSRTRREFT